MFQITINDDTSPGDLNLAKPHVDRGGYHGDTNGDVSGTRELSLLVDGEPKWEVTTALTFAYRGDGTWALDHVGRYPEFDADDPGFEVRPHKDWEELTQEDRTTAITLIRALYRPEPPHAALTALRTKALTEEADRVEKILTNLRTQLTR